MKHIATFFHFGLPVNELKTQTVTQQVIAAAVCLAFLALLSFCLSFLIRSF
jgi:hypothetical protein